MDRLRLVFEWINSRRIFSFSFVFVLLVVILGFRYVMKVSDGQLTPPIQRGKIIDAVYGIGTIVPYQRHSFNPLVASTVEKSFVREGDRVTKGEALLKTSDGLMVRAPFDGVVNFFPYRSGENAYSTTPMIILTDFSKRYVLVSIEQQGALRVKVGQTAKISFDSLRQTTYEGTVSAVYSYASNFLARIDSVNLPETILPDMTCDVAVTVGVHENAILIPIAAFDNGGVWVKRGHSIPHLVPIKLGITDGVWSEVMSGDVQPGDQLVIRKQVSN